MIVNHSEGQLHMSESWFQKVSNVLICTNVARISPQGKVVVSPGRPPIQAGGVGSGPHVPDPQNIGAVVGKFSMYILIKGEHGSIPLSSGYSQNW